MSQTPPVITPADLAHCTQMLEAIAADVIVLSQLSNEERIRLLVAAGRVINPDKVQVRRRIKAMRVARRRDRENRDRLVRAATTIRESRRDSFYVPPARQLTHGTTTSEPARPLEKPRDCYICKAEFSHLHFFYDSMCPDCASFNYEKRFQTASLEGRVALITGARLKIGYQAALMLLRAGARVIVTTRFAQDAAERFAREEDFARWGSRLQIHGLDLRHSPSVEVFARYLDQTLDRLDILINNAAQTVRRPPGFYAHLLENERRLHAQLTPRVQSLLASHEECKRRLTAETTGEATVAPSPDHGRWLAEWSRETLW